MMSLSLPRTLQVTVVAAAAVFIRPFMAFASAKPADTVFTGGKVYTVNEKQPWAAAVAVEGTDIVYVGDNKGAKDFIGKKTTLADLKGKFVMPGIISRHEHPMMVMALASGLTLEYTEDTKKMLASVKEYVEKNPPPYLFSWEGVRK